MFPENHHNFNILAMINMISVKEGKCRTI